MEIQPNEAEREVVCRLCDLLKIPRQDYEVTGTYCIFSSLICWTTQRWRDNKSEIAKRLANDFRSERVSSDLWQSCATEYSNLIRFPRGDQTSKQVADATVHDFLIFLRNATAHNDHRSVVPWNDTRGKEPSLIGFHFVFPPTPSSSMEAQTVVSLTAEDMIQIGSWVAERFLRAFAPGGISQPFKERPAA